MITLKKSELLGFSLINDLSDQSDPILSAKISAPPPDVAENPGGIYPAENGTGGSVIDGLTNSGSSGSSAGGNTFNIRPHILSKYTTHKNLNSNDYASFLTGDFSKNLWGMARFGGGSIDGNSTTRGAGYDIFSLILGTDILTVANQSRFGVFGGYTNSDYQVRGNSDTHGESNFYQVGIYLTNKFYRNMNFTGVLSAGFGSSDSTRATNTGLAKGNYDTTGFFGDMEVSYDNPVDINKNKVILSPFARLSYGKTDREGYTESGPGSMSVKSEDIEKFTTVLGGRVQTKIQDKDIQLTPSARVGWAHQHSDTVAGLVTSTALVSTGAPISKNLDIARDSVRVNLDTFVTNSKYKDNMAFYISYAGDFASNAHSNIFSAGLKVIFE